MKFLAISAALAVIKAVHDVVDRLADATFTARATVRRAYVRHGESILRDAVYSQEDEATVQEAVAKYMRQNAIAARAQLTTRIGELHEKAYR